MEDLMAVVAFVVVLLYAVWKLRQPIPTRTQLEMERIVEHSAQTDAVDQWAGELLRLVPPGRVILFSQMLFLLHLGKNSLALSRSLKNAAETDAYPWWRVVKAKGKKGLAVENGNEDKQREKLAQEGLVLAQEGTPLEGVLWQWPQADTPARQAG